MEEESYRQRKLTPIYNAIESHSFRNAIKLCSRKDVADWAQTKSLKAIALEKLGHRQEAVDICREIKSAVPLDDHLLHTTSLTFRALGLHDEVTEMYTAAVARCPSLPNLHVELFFCHVREYNFLKQQQQASKLFKLLGHRKYLMWSAVSMLMQIREGGNPRLLELGEKMIYKSISEQLESKEPTYEEVLLYITILKEQKKYKEGIEVLQTWGLGQGRGLAEIEDEDSLKTGSVVTIQPQEIAGLKAELLHLDGDYLAAREEYAGLLQKYPDQWEFYLSYLDCALLGCGEAEDATPSFWETVASCTQFIGALKEAEAHLRGPFLGEMELIKRVIKIKGPDSVWSGESNPSPESIGCAALLQIRVQGYYEKFSDKLCCFSDMCSALSIFAQAFKNPEDQGLTLQRQQLLDYFQASIEASETPQIPQEREEPISAEEKKEGISRLRRLICAIQVRRFLGVHEQATDEVLIQEINFAFREYKATLYLNQGSTGGQREVQYGDELVLVAAHILMDLAHRATSEDLRYFRLMEAMLILKMALNNSGYNYQMKLALIQIHKELGTFEQGILLQNDLEIKQIQVDSLSWLLLPGCLASCYFEEARSRCFSVKNFHKNTAGDVADGIRTAYDCGNFMKATEIVDFQQKKLNISMQLAQCKSEMISLELLLNLHSVQSSMSFLQEVVGGFSEASINFSDEELWKLSINHDFNAAVTYVYADEAAELEQKRLKMTWKIKIRLMMAKLLLHTLQGDSQKVISDLPGAEQLLQDAGYLCPANGQNSSEIKIEDINVQLENTNLEDANSKKSFAEIRASIWTLNLQGMRFLADVHRSFQNTALVSDSANLLSTLSSISETIQQISAFCNGQRRAFPPTVDVPGDGSGPLSPSWIKAIASLLLDALPQICVIFLAAVDLMPFKKKKNKKGKKGSAPSDPPEVKIVKDAFKSNFEKLLQLVVKLRDIMKREANVEKSQEQVIAEVLASKTVLPFLFEEEHQEVTRNACKDVLQSNVQSAERALEILKEKLSGLQNVKMH